jgi:hypothetical protein
MVDTSGVVRRGTVWVGLSPEELVAVPKAVKRIVHRKIASARKRSWEKDWEFDLTDEFLERLWVSQNGRCAVSDIPFQCDRLGWTGAAKNNPYSMSLDRIDSTKGYTQNNVRLVITAVNIGMMDWPDEIYRYVARRVAQNFPGKTRGPGSLEKTDCENLRAAVIEEQLAATT